MTVRRATHWVIAGAAATTAVWAVPRIVGAQDADGFDGYIQSGTCAARTDDLRVELDGSGDHDVEPYEATSGNGDETTILGYYGSPPVPGFGFSAIYTSQPFSLVITGGDDDDPVACGDILQPDRDRYAEAGVAVVQLLPVEESAVQGVALIDRLPMERELDITPTRVRIVLSDDTDIAATAAGEGYDGYIRNGTCDSPGDRLRTDLRGHGDHDIDPFVAQLVGSDEVVTPAYAGSPLVPGYGFAVTYSAEPFSLVIDGAGEPFACGDILEPADDRFAEAGTALVQLRPAGNAGGSGFALIERIPLERENDVIPTRVRAVLFTPAITGG